MNDTNESLTQEDNKLIAERRAKLAKRRAEGSGLLLISPVFKRNLK